MKEIEVIMEDEGEEVIALTIKEMMIRILIEEEEKTIKIGNINITTKKPIEEKMVSKKGIEMSSEEENNIKREKIVRKVKLLMKFKVKVKDTKTKIYRKEIGDKRRRKKKNKRFKMKKILKSNAKKTILKNKMKMIRTLILMNILQKLQKNRKKRQNLKMNGFQFKKSKRIISKEDQKEIKNIKTEIKGK